MSVEQTIFRSAIMLYDFIFYIIFFLKINDSSGNHEDISGGAALTMFKNRGGVGRGSRLYAGSRWGVFFHEKLSKRY